MLFGVNHPEVEVRRGWATGNTFSGFYAENGYCITYRYETDMCRCVPTLENLHFVGWE